MCLKVLPASLLQQNRIHLKHLKHKEPKEITLPNLPTELSLE